MQPLLAFSRAVDALSERFGRIADWMVLLACAVSAGNAFLRYSISVGSNAWLEMQWYLFAGVVMLGASHTLFRNEHVRVDILYGWVAPRTRLWIDILGLILFLLPAMALLAWMTWPVFLESFLRGEMSGNPGGLIRWPAKLLMPLGFALMVAQGLSELIKRIAVLNGVPTGGTQVFTEYARPEQ
jgi:TRAP-type mannitol/chloroaromatic compound transport system permease small subunit